MSAWSLGVVPRGIQFPALIRLTGSRSFPVVRKVDRVRQASPPPGEIRKTPRCSCRTEMFEISAAAAGNAVEIRSCSCLKTCVRVSPIGASRPLESFTVEYLDGADASCGRPDCDKPATRER